MEAVVCWIEAHPGLASYVQAIGAIAAIGVAIWLARLDAANRRKAEREADLRLAANVLAAVERCGSLAATARDEALDRLAHRGYFDTYKQWKFETAIRVLDSIPIFQVPISDLMHDILEMRDTFAMLPFDLEHVRGQWNAYDAVPYDDEIEMHADYVAEKVAHIRSVIDNFRAD